MDFRVALQKVEWPSWVSLISLRESCKVKGFMCRYGLSVELQKDVQVCMYFAPLFHGQWRLVVRTSDLPAMARMEISENELSQVYASTESLIATVFEKVSSFVLIKGAE